MPTPRTLADFKSTRADTAVRISAHGAAGAMIRDRLLGLPTEPTRTPAAFRLAEEAMVSAASPGATRILRLGGDAAADLGVFAPDGSQILWVAGEGELRPAHLSFGARDLVPTNDAITLDEILGGGVRLTELAQRRWPFARPRPTVLAVHLNAFARAGAHGASALGVDPLEFWPLLQIWFRRLDVRLFGIYGLDPERDPAGFTADFAARMGRAFLHV